MTLEVVRALQLHERRRDGIDDYVRVFGAGDAGQLTAVLASASESGWDMCWPVGQELFLAAFAAAQHAGLELAVCFEHAAMS
ncbi:MAG TPA: hypothetical protein VM869_10960, partial [Enhygromyxa sp.]|nr:hypothetical protein [Enhygromyxa sp.]